MQRRGRSAVAPPLMNQIVPPVNHQVSQRERGGGGGGRGEEKRRREEKESSQRRRERRYHLVCSHFEGVISRIWFRKEGARSIIIRVKTRRDRKWRRVRGRSVYIVSNTQTTPD